MKSKKGTHLEWKAALALSTTEIQNQTSAEEVFQKMLVQPVTLTLGEVLGSSFELGKHFLKANQSHCLLVQKSLNAMAEYESEEEVLMS